MSTLKRKFELIKRLESLGFSFDEAQSLRKIEMTLHRWAEAECNGEIQRDEKTGKCHSVSHGHGRPWVSHNPIADREAGALKRLKAIIEARNLRVCPPVHVTNSPVFIQTANAGEWVYSYQQTDPRGCALYLLKRADLPEGQGETIESILSRYYSRGLAVCA